MSIGMIKASPQPLSKREGLFYVLYLTYCIEEPSPKERVGGGFCYYLYLIVI
jgi:hypothetical protein